MRSAVKRGLKLSCFIVIGFPDDTPATLRRTLWLIRRMAVLGVWDVAVSKFVPYPGSALFRRLQQEGKIELDDRVLRLPDGLLHVPGAVLRRRRLHAAAVLDDAVDVRELLRHLVHAAALAGDRTLLRAIFTGTEDSRYAKWFVDIFYTRRRWRKIAGEAAR